MANRRIKKKTPPPKPKKKVVETYEESSSEESEVDIENEVDSSDEEESKEAAVTAENLDQRFAEIKLLHVARTRGNNTSRMDTRNPHSFFFFLDKIIDKIIDTVLDLHCT